MIKEIVSSEFDRKSFAALNEEVCCKKKKCCKKYERKGKFCGKCPNR